MRGVTRSIMVAFATFGLGACAHGPEPLGAATEANIERQAVHADPGSEARDAISGGQGGRAGNAVKRLRDSAGENGA